VVRSMKMRSIQHAGSSSTALRAAEASLVMPSPCLFLARDILFHTCFVYPLASFCACFSMLKVKIYSENPGHMLPERLWMQSENHRIIKHLKLEERRTIESNRWLHTAPPRIQTLSLRAVSKRTLNSQQLGAMPTALWCRPCP